MLRRAHLIVKEVLLPPMVKASRLRRVLIDYPFESVLVQKPDNFVGFVLGCGYVQLCWSHSAGKFLMGFAWL